MLAGNGPSCESRLVYSGGRLGEHIGAKMLEGEGEGQCPPDAADDVEGIRFLTQEGFVEAVKSGPAAP